MVFQEALLDELCKISEAKEEKKEQSSGWKRAKNVLRNAAVISLGAGAGTLASNALYPFASKHLAHLSPEARMQALMALQTFGPVVGGLLSTKLQEESMKRQ